MHIVQLSILLAAAGVSHSMCAVSCKPLISTCLFNGIAAMQSYPLPLALPLVHVGAQTPTHMYTHTHTGMHAQPPSHLALLPYTQSSQAYQVCFCCCCRANEQCTKTKDQAKLLLSDPLWRGEERERGREREQQRERERGKDSMAETQGWLAKVSLYFVKIYSYSHVRKRCRVLCMN